MAVRQKGYLIAGIGGVTNGGKTTICNTLKQSFSADSLHMDEYFWHEDSSNHVRLQEFKGHANWDTIEAVNFNLMHADILNWIERAGSRSTENNAVSNQSFLPILFVEGILILNDPRIRQLCDCKFYLTLTKEQCLERRLLRRYEPPDPEGYFEGCVWPMYRKWKDALREQSDIMFMSGAYSLNNNIERIRNHIVSLFE